MSKNEISPQKQLELLIKNMEEASDEKLKRFIAFQIVQKMWDVDILDALSEQGEGLYPYLKTGQGALIHVLNNCQEKETINCISGYLCEATSHRYILEKLSAEYRPDYVGNTQKAFIAFMQKSKSLVDTCHISEKLLSLTEDMITLESLPEESRAPYTTNSQNGFISIIKDHTKQVALEEIAGHLYNSTYSYNIRSALPEKDYPAHVQNGRMVLDELDQLYTVEAIKAHMFQANDLAQKLTPENQEVFNALRENSITGEISAHLFFSGNKLNPGE